MATARCCGLVWLKKCPCVTDVEVMFCCQMKRSRAVRLTVTAEVTVRRASVSVRTATRAGTALRVRQQSVHYTIIDRKLDSLFSIALNCALWQRWYEIVCRCMFLYVEYFILFFIFSILGILVLIVIIIIIIIIIIIRFVIIIL